MADEPLNPDPPAVEESPDDYTPAWSATAVVEVKPSAESAATPREGIEALGATTGVEAAPPSSIPTGGDISWLDSILLTLPDDNAVVPKLRNFQKAGVEAAKTAVIPHRKMETWRFTDLRKLYAARFVVPETTYDSEMINVAAPAEVGTFLVFIDGVYNHGLSNLDPDFASLHEAGGFFGSIAEYEGDLEAVHTALSRKETGYAEGGMFAALNAALARDACVLNVPADFKFEKPLAFIAVTTGGYSDRSATISAPKCVVLAGKGSETVILETHVAADPVARPWFSSTTGTCINVSADAKVQHFYLNNAPDSSQIISNIHADVATNGLYRICSVCVGSQVGRLNVGIDLNEEGGHAESLGVMIADDYRIADLHSRISHNAPGCTSNQYQKNVASGHGRVIFNGRVLVERDAQLTDSQQLCRSLLLTSKAQIDAMPVLEIKADDVKCTHGATISNLSEDELFYLQSRGITKAIAKELLVVSFALDALRDCPFSVIRDIAGAVSRKLVPGMEQLPVGEADMMSI